MEGRHIFDALFPIGFGRTEVGSRNAVRTKAEARPTIRLALRADGYNREVGIDALKRPKSAGRSLASLAFRDRP